MVVSRGNKSRKFIQIRWNVDEINLFHSQFKTGKHFCFHAFILYCKLKATRHTSKNLRPVGKTGLRRFSDQRNQRGARDNNGRQSRKQHEKICTNSLEDEMNLFC